MSLPSDRLDGPKLPPASGGPAKHLIVLLHGYGADGQDLLPIGQAWASELPDAAFVSPNGPQPCDEFPIGRQWFRLTLRDQAEIAAGLASVAPLVNAFFDSELEALGLDDRNLALVGFSQGAMVALHVGLQRPGPIAAVISFSGLLAKRPTGTSFPPVLLGHGAEDPLIPAGALETTKAGLTGAGVRVEAHLRPGLGHGIDGEEIALGVRFLTSALAG